MKIGYADPPYPGQSHLYRNHPDYAGEVDHAELLAGLDATYDGWVLHTSSPALSGVLALAAAQGIAGFRIMAWVKPFAAFKRNVSVAYAWEPVLIKPARKPIVSGRLVMRDWVEAEPDVLPDCVKQSITLKRGLTGVKPDPVCRWAFEMLGANQDDELEDIFPGTGAVMAAWNAWQAELALDHG
jgi:hypothetical protein